MNETEQHIASLILRNALSDYLDSEVNIQLGSTKVSESDLVKAFQNDTWNAVDYFLGTKIRLSGKVSKAGWLSPNQSFVKFITPKSLATLQLFMAKNEVAPSVKRGTQVSFYCSIAETGGVVLISDCYTQDRAESLIIIEHMKQLDQFLKGGNPANAAIPYATLWSIIANQHLPKKSACFSKKSKNYRACASDVYNLNKDSIKSEWDRLFRELKARGLKL